MSLRWSFGTWLVHVLHRFRAYGAGCNVSLVENILTPSHRDFFHNRRIVEFRGVARNDRPSGTNAVHASAALILRMWRNTRDFEKFARAEKIRANDGGNCPKDEIE